MPRRLRPENLARARRIISGPSPLRLPRRWPLERLATCALALGVVVVLVFAWMFLANAWGMGGPEASVARMLDPAVREGSR